MEDRKELIDYLDCYTSDIESLNIRLLELVGSLKYDEISNKLLEECGYSLDEICDIFSHHNYTNSIAFIFDNLSIELAKLDIEQLNPKELESFEILENIVKDINNYIYMYFIKRTFTDVNVFRDSLKSNIKYFLSEVNSEEDDDSEIDFL